MADNYNLVDSMISDMQRNNSPDVLNYQPQMGGGMPPQMGGPGMDPRMMQQGGMSPINQQGQVRMGEVQYIPPEQQQAPTMQNGMMENMAGEPMIPDDMVPEEAAMDAPDLTNYGMDDDDTGSGGMVDKLFNEAKGPLIVVALAFVMSLPQVNSMIRNLLSRVTTNPMYINVAMALLLGLVFFVIMKFIS